MPRRSHAVRCILTNINTHVEDNSFDFLRSRPLQRPRATSLVPSRTAAGGKLVGRVIRGEMAIEERWPIEIKQNPIKIGQHCAFSAVATTVLASLHPNLRENNNDNVSKLLLICSKLVTFFYSVK